MPQNNEQGRFAYDGLERIFHEKARLGIMTSLISHSEGLLFSDLKELCSLTDGNLSRHIQHLKEQEFVEIWKGFKNNRPQTLCRITKCGRQRFLSYLSELQKVIEDSHVTEVEAQQSHNDKLNGWVTI